MPYSRTICSRALVALIAVFAAATVAPEDAAAAKAPGGLSDAELKAISPLFKRHDVIGVAESLPNGEPASMTLAVRVKASRAVAFSALEDPSNFYYLSTLFKENEVVQEHDNSKAWTWASRHKLFSFTGTNTIELFPPRRADVRIAKSSVGRGEFTFTFHEDGPDYTIIVLSGILDVQSSEWLIRYLLGGNPSMRQAMNVAIGLVCIKGVKALAERIAAGKAPDKHRTGGKAGGTLKLTPIKELTALAPLIARGQVIVVDSNSRGRMRQVTTIENVNAPAKAVLDAISTPNNYQKAIRAITDVTVHSATPTEIIFSWTLGFSVFGITSRNRMATVDQGVVIEGLDGDLAGATWRWQVVPVSANSTVVAYHGFADVKKAAYILEKTVQREPYLEHGLMAGSNMVMLRAMKRAVEKATAPSAAPTPAKP
jgi:carbon monoxide dehydrogenase subunit G